MPGDMGDARASARCRIKRPDTQGSISRTASRALDILEYFGQVRRPARAIEIARALEMQPSSTSQILKTLVDSSHLVFDGRQKTYQPSHRLTGFGAWVAESYGADLRLNHILRALENRLGTIVTLSAPNDLFMQILDFVSPLPKRSSAERGMQVSIFGSAAIGDAYLCQLPDREVERLAGRAHVPRQALPAMFEKLGQARRQGFAFGQAGNPEFRSMAMALPRARMPIPMVIGIADKPERIDRERNLLFCTMQTAITQWLSG